MEIIKSTLTDEIKTVITNGFRAHFLEKTGIKQGVGSEILFEATINGKSIGFLVVRLFGGQLNIKNLLVNKKLGK